MIRRGFTVAYIYPASISVYFLNSYIDSLYMYKMQVHIKILKHTKKFLSQQHQQKKERKQERRGIFYLSETSVLLDFPTSVGNALKLKKCVLRTVIIYCNIL